MILSNQSHISLFDHLLRVIVR